ncbi:NUDIX domain-containing protein [Candidatus Saccharibacteria bacterium]|nr:NUDIX domain-containing protein [Candidatus Saccharibacteria bacterium]MCB9821184.1 NUDIX domain-containing protein [Candidatus Nomurabacteria bacterium]
MNEDIAFKGRLFEIVHLLQADGRVFEVARRAPGVRLIVANQNEKKILLTKEFRRELDAWDYRLPGGKVFDSLDEYEAFRQSGKDILVAARSKATQEGAEEAGVDIKDVELFEKSTLGATVEWDLFVFEVTNWQAHKDGQKLEDGENIEADNWFSYGQAKQMILNGEMQEHRIALLLLQWLEKQNDR